MCLLLGSQCLPAILTACNKKRYKSWCQKMAGDNHYENEMYQLGKERMMANLGKVSIWMSFISQCHFLSSNLIPELKNEKLNCFKMRKSHSI